MFDFHGEGVLGSIIRSTALKSIIGISLLVAWCGQPAAAQSFSNMVFFGDSGTDNGIYKPTVDVVRRNQTLLNALKSRSIDIPPLATGIPTTTPGLMWS